MAEIRPEDVEAALDELCDPGIVVTNATLEDFLEQIAALTNDNLPRYTALIPSKDISPFLNALKAKEVIKSVADVSATCGIFKMLFTPMTPLEVITKYWRNLGDGLAEDNHHMIQAQVLVELKRIAKDSKAVLELAGNEELLGLIIDRLDNCIVAARAQDVLVHVTLQVPSAYKTLFNEKLWPRIQRVQEKDAICKIRVYEVYCRIAVCSAETASRLNPQLYQVVASFREVHKDVLVQLNYVELLTVLVASKHTVQFIVDSGVIPDMKKLLVDTTNKRAVFLEPGVCEFFGRFGESHPRLICDGYLDILKFMIELTKNPQFQALAISNLGLIGRTHEGKRCLNEKLKLDMVVLMKSIGELLEGHTMSFLKEASLSALSHFLEVEDSEQEDLMTLTRSWFTAVCDTPTKAVWDCVRNPNPEVRQMAFAALRSIALLPWGRDALLEDCAGFFEWVLNRDPDLRKAETDAKFAIVAALVEDANNIKCSEKRAALRAHFSEGPYTSGAALSVASEFVH